MKRYVLSGMLVVIEVLLFCLIAMLFGFDAKLIVKTTILLVLFLFVFEHYSITSKLVWDEMKSLFKAMVCFFVVSVVLISSENELLTLKLFAIVLIMYIATLILDRSLRIVFRNVFARRTLIIGVGDNAERLGRISNNNRFALTKVIGYVRYKNENINADLIERYEYNVSNNKKSFELFEGCDLENIIEKERIEQVILAVPNLSKEESNKILLRLYDHVKVIKYVPDIEVIMTFNSKIQDFDGILLISTAQGSMGYLGRIIKRSIDIIAGIVGLLLLFPLMLYVRRKNRKNGDYNSIFFKQERIGLDGKPITIYKFRTMIPNAEKVLDELMMKDPDIRNEYLTNKKLVNDPRITEAGEFLRKSSLDEFPQFINVLKGEMSLVGPRPYLFREKEDMGVYYESVIKCKPGITGMWQANGRSDVGFEERCKLDDYYYRNWTISLDMVIIYKTIRSVIYGKGAL